MTAAPGTVQERIALLVSRIQDDRARSSELFNYTWTMLCVRRGLMRVVRETWVADTKQLVVEETRSGRQHIVQCAAAPVEQREE